MKNKSRKDKTYWVPVEGAEQKIQQLYFYRGKLIACITDQGYAFEYRDDFPPVWLRYTTRFKRVSKEPPMKKPKEKR